MSNDAYGNKYFAISSFYISVFLLVKGLKLVDIDRSNPQRSQFIFIDSSEREELVKQYNYAERNSPEVLVDAREFEIGIKALKEKLYQNE